MNDSPPYALLLKRDKTEEMFGKHLEAYSNCFAVISDLVNGVVEVPNKQETLEVLCEFVAACRLTKTALGQIFTKENMVEDEKYQVDNMQIETLRSSWYLLATLTQHLQSVNLSLTKH